MEDLNPKVLRICAHVGVQAVLYAILKNSTVLVPDKVAERAKWTVSVLTILVLVPLIGSAALCVYQHHGGSSSTGTTTSSTTDERWYGVTAAGTFHVEIYIAMQLVATYLDVCVMPGSLASKGPILLHHGISLGAYVNQCVTGRMEYFANLAGLSELTTLPLMIIVLARDPGYGPQFKHHILGPLYPLCAVALWLWYIVFRLLLFPYWLYRFTTDLYEDYEEGSSNNNNNEGAGGTAQHREELALRGVLHSRLNLVERYGNPVVIVILLLMSVVWFYKIHQGLMKVLVGKTPDDHLAHTPASSSSEKQQQQQQQQQQKKHESASSENTKKNKKH
jgi:hypothetical protein